MEDHNVHTDVNDKILASKHCFPNPVFIIHTWNCTRIFQSSETLETIASIFLLPGLRNYTVFAISTHPAYHAHFGRASTPQGPLISAYNRHHHQKSDPTQPIPPQSITRRSTPETIIGELEHRVPA